MPPIYLCNVKGTELVRQTIEREPIPLKFYSLLIFYKVLTFAA